VEIDPRPDEKHFGEASLGAAQAGIADELAGLTTKLSEDYAAPVRSPLPGGPDRGPEPVLANTIRLKHASSCPQSALALEEVFRDAGVPAGVFTNLFLEPATSPP
jgi:hypothetical protein